MLIAIAIFTWLMDYYAKNLISMQNSRSFALGSEAYDIDASGYSSSIYFSNGVGVVKLNKDTMKASDWAWTGGIAGPRGWAMGLKVLNFDGDKIVVFNNSNILVLDSNLNKVASVEATEEDDSVYPTENLFES